MKNVEIAPAKGKLGILLVGLGAVSTTTIAGVLAIRKGLAKPIGSLTQMGTIRLGKRTEGRSPKIKDTVPLADLERAPALAREAIEMGAAALLIASSCPPGHAHSHIALDAVWAGRYRVERPSVIATVPLGYADGVRRDLAAAGGEVLINGRRRPIAGTVTMDQLMVDCGDDETVAVGDEVVLIGRQGDDEVPATEWASRLDTIGYEIVCGIGPRVPRHWTGGGR